MKNANSKEKKKHAVGEPNESKLELVRESEKCHGQKITKTINSKYDPETTQNGIEPRR